MIRGPYFTVFLLRLGIIFTFLWPAYVQGQLIPELYYFYNFLSPSQPGLNYPLNFTATNFFPTAYPTYYPYGLSGLQNPYSFGSGIGNDIFTAPNVRYAAANNHFAAANNYFAAANNYFAAANNYFAAATSDVSGTWVGRRAKSYWRRSNSWGGDDGRDYGQTYPINLNLAQYQGVVTGIAVLAENNTSTVVNVDGNLSGNQISFLGILPADVYPENYRFKANAVLQGDTIRGSYTITDTSVLATIEVGSFNVTRKNTF